MTTVVFVPRQTRKGFIRWLMFLQSLISFWFNFSQVWTAGKNQNQYPIFVIHTMKLLNKALIQEFQMLLYSEGPGTHLCLQRVEMGNHLDERQEEALSVSQMLSTSGYQKRDLFGCLASQDCK